MPTETAANLDSHLATRSQRPAGADLHNPLGPYRSQMTAELSAISRYFDRVIELGRDGATESPFRGELRCRECWTARGVESLPDMRNDSDKRTLIILQISAWGWAALAPMLEELRARIGRSARVAIVYAGQFDCELPAAWRQVRVRHVGYAPRHALGLGPIVNHLLPTVPIARRLSAFKIAILRPIIPADPRRRPSISIVVPARNERGNIGKLLGRLPDFGGAEVEVIFVEGHSTDSTWNEIERLTSGRGATNQPPRAARVRAIRQAGRGKADAVHTGLAAATGDLVAILDADLTMPPESLIEFYDAYCEGRGDFINGDRFTLPMERGAMRPLNWLGNRFFAWALTHTLDTRLTDSLCGTKMFARSDYERFEAWSADFRVRDPFGDFKLLFPAAALGLGCVNVPVRYAARTYGRTNIHRFRDGARLLAMVLLGWWRVKAGATEC